MSPPSDENSATHATAPPAAYNKSAAPPHTGSTGAVAEAERVAARHASEGDPAGRPGSYVMGNVIFSLIVGILTFVWLLIFGVPYPLLLAIMVALLDLVPVVGSAVAGVVVSLVALTVSVPVMLATAVFFVLYQFLESYVLFPKIIGRVVDVPSVITVVAVLLGGVAFGIVGALVAIPVAAAILLIVQEVLLPQLDQA